ncbi:MAG: helix-hairpin-helix domain-containing protein [Nocardioides sp.]|nr:helix-hairpin-helix domain-containing protein [Nocardioides sp.]
MRARRPSDDELSAVARRRLALIGEELDLLRGDPPPAVHPGAAPEEAVRVPEEPGVPGEPEGEHDAVVDPALPRVVPPVGRHREGGAGAPLLRDLGDRALAVVPDTLRGRVALTSAHLALVAVAVALALVVTTWWVVRATGEPEAPAPISAAPVPGGALVADVAPSTTPPAPGGPPSSSVVGAVPDEQDEAVVVVDVAGKVRRPGIATLPVGSRVVDALEAAGGVRRGVSTTALNLARILVDGEQILVGLPGLAAGPAAAPAPSGGVGTPGLVNLNTATLAELETLRGVGPVTAQAILDWRTEHGRFTTVEELLEVSGIGEKTLAGLAPHVTV